jgi:hypothetical protein
VSAHIKTIVVAGGVVGKQLSSTRGLGARLKSIVVAGTRIYLALAVLQFMLGLLLGGGLVLLGYDFAGAVALLRGLN